MVEIKLKLTKRKPNICWDINGEIMQEFFYSDTGKCGEWNMALKLGSYNSIPKQEIIVNVG